MISANGRNADRLFVLLAALAITVPIATPMTNMVLAMVAVPKVIASPSGGGRFDWMFVDAKRRKLLAAHRDAGALDVINLDTGKASSAKVGHVQGVDMDEAGHYFAGDEKDQRLVVLDAKTLKVDKDIPTAGEIDAIAYCPKNKLVYADHDDGTDVWAIDPVKGKIVQTIDVGGAPEFIEFDSSTKLLYQNVKTTNSVAVIDPSTNKVVNTFSTLPAESPHGLAIDSKAGRIFTAGRNGKLVVLDVASGKRIAEADIAPGVDQIAMDHTNNRIYCACKGFVSMLEETADGVKFIKSIPAHAGAHTLAVDPKTHAVWISYGDKTTASLERLDVD